MSTEIKQEVIRFTESAEEELKRLYDELQIADLVTALRSGKMPLDLQTLIVPLTTAVLDLFGTGTPTIGMNPIEALKSASRDINLSRILRERGLFRLFRLLNTDDDKGRPLYKGLIDPNTGIGFNRCEDLVGWFCHSAKVSRSIVFMRLATIDKLLGLGFSLDQAYQTILTKPYAINETLKEIGEWYKGELDVVEPGTAMRLAEKYLPAEEIEIVRRLTDIVRNDDLSDQDRDDAQNKLIERIIPAISKLVREVAAHESPKDAMDFVRSDIANRPEINYSWDYERDELICEFIVKGKMHGTEYIKAITVVRFLPDQPVPSELRNELTTRLPIKNRMKQN